MNLTAALEIKNTLEVKKIVRDLAPGGVINYDRLYKECSSIALAVKINGPALTATQIYFLVEDCNLAFNVFQPMTRPQIMDFVEEVMLDLGGYTMEDLAIFFAGVKKGYWGKVNSRFDGTLLWEFWGEYSRAREEHFYRKESQHSTNDATEKRSGQLFLEQGIKDNLKKINEAWDKRK